MAVRRADAAQVALGAGDACAISRAASDLEMIAAYFAPMGGMLKRIGARRRRGRARVIIRRQVRQSADHRRRAQHL